MENEKRHFRKIGSIYLTSRWTTQNSER